MSTQAVIDHLTKQIFIEKNIVTYRSLSRQLRVHVNIAKNELATYRSVAPYQSQVACATYLVSGEALTSRRSVSEDVEMDDGGRGECEEPEEPGEAVSQMMIMLVNEKDLPNVQSKFSHINSIHIYSLAPAPIHDAGLICTPTDSIRAIDFGTQAQEIASTVGKIVASNIKMPVARKAKATHQPIAGPSKAKPLKLAEKPAVEEPAKEEVVIKKEVKATAKSFFFSKPKTKETDKQPVAEKAAANSNAKDEEKEKAPKRGTKRRSSISASGLDEQSPVPPATLSKAVRVKNRRVVSDDDEQDLPRPASKLRSTRPSKPVGSDEEQDVNSLMDIDDDHVMHVTRETPAPGPIKEEEEESSAEDIPEKDTRMDDDDCLPAVKPKKRREKKTIPIGSNGLKKKRVTKSRQTTDAKGYTIFEDYSSYESVDENEEPSASTQAKVKGKLKPKPPKKEDSVTLAPEIKSNTVNSKGVKSSKSGAGGSKGSQPKQKKLANFFMAPPKAKD